MLARYLQSVAIAIALTSCQLPSAGASLVLNLSVPGFPQAPGVPDAVASRALSPYATTADVRVTLPDGTIREVLGHPVVSGTYNRLELALPFAVEASVAVSVYDASSRRVASGSVSRVAIGASTPVAMTLAPDPGVVHGLAIDGFSPGSHFSLSLIGLPGGIGEGDIRYFEVVVAMGGEGDYLFSLSDFGRCWMRVYETDGTPVTGIGGDPSDGWTAFHAREDRSYLLAIAPPPGKALGGSTDIWARKVNYARAGAPGVPAPDGSRERPYNDLSTLPINSNSGQAWLVSGSFTLSSPLDIRRNAAVIGGFSPDFTRLDRDSYPTIVSAVPDVANLSLIQSTDDGSFPTILVSGLSLKPIDAASSQESSGIGVTRAVNSCTLRARNCDIDIGRASGTGATAAGITIAVKDGTIELYGNRIHGGTLAAGANACTLAGIQVLAGNTVIERNEIRAGSAEGPCIQPSMIGVLVRDFPDTLTLHANVIDAGDYGRESDPITVSGDLKMAGVLVQSVSTPGNGLAAARNAIFGGEAWLAVPSDYARLSGLSVESTLLGGDIDIYNNVISGGFVSIPDTDIDTSYQTLGFSWSPTGSGYFVFNTVESGTVRCPSPRAGATSMICAQIQADTDLGILANVLLPSREEPTRAFAMYFPDLAFASSVIVDGNGFGTGRAISLPGDEHRSIEEFDALASRHTLALDTAAWFPSWRTPARSAADLVAGVFRPSSLVPPAYREAWTNPLSEDLMKLDFAGRTRAIPTAMGAYRL